MASSPEPGPRSTCSPVLPSTIRNSWTRSWAESWSGRGGRESCSSKALSASGWCRWRASTPASGRCSETFSPAGSPTVGCGGGWCGGCLLGLHGLHADGERGHGVLLVDQLVTRLRHRHVRLGDLLEQA